MNRSFSFRKTDWFTIANLSFNIYKVGRVQ